MNQKLFAAECGVPCFGGLGLQVRFQLHPELEIMAEDSLSHLPLQMVRRWMQLSLERAARMRQLRRGLFLLQNENRSGTEADLSGAKWCAGKDLPLPARRLCGFGSSIYYHLPMLLEPRLFLLPMKLIGFRTSIRESARCRVRLPAM